MSTLRNCLLFLVLCLFGGCETKKPDTVVEYIVILPPDSLIQDCLLSPPPAPTYYMGKVIDEREGLLWETTMNHYKEVGVCNQSPAGLRLWKAKQRLIYKTKE